MTLEQIFLTFLNLSITGGWVIAVLMLLGLALGRLPKRYSCWFWLIPAFRLLCPVSISSVWSLFSLPTFRTAAGTGDGMTYVPQDIGMAVVPEVSTGLSPLDTLINGSLPAATPQYSMNPMQGILFIAAVVWLLGVIVMAGYAAISYGLLRRRLRTAVQTASGIKCAETVETPFLMGFLHPTIYLPYGLDDTVTRYVIAHENAHKRYFDYLTKPFAYLLLILHWYNPLVWLGFRTFCRDLELRADEAVLTQCGNDKDTCTAYGDALVTVASAAPRFSAPKPLAFGETGIRARIRALLTKKPCPRWYGAMAAVAAVLVLAACAADPVGSMELPSSGLPDDAAVYLLPEEALYLADGAGLPKQLYALRETSLISYDLLTGEVLHMTSAPSGLQWESEKISAQTLTSVFDAIDQDVPTVLKNALVCAFAKDLALAKTDNDLYLLQTDEKGTTLLAVCRLKPVEQTQQSYGFDYAQWEFNPALSSQYPAFPFAVSDDIVKITATCTNGVLVDFDADSNYPSGKTLTLTDGHGLYWSPGQKQISLSEPNEDLPAVLFSGETVITLTATLQDGTTVDGTITITEEQLPAEEKSGVVRYLAVFDAEELVLVPDAEQGAVISVKTEVLNPANLPYV